MKRTALLLVIAGLWASPLFGGEEALVLEINVFQGYRAGLSLGAPEPPTVVVLPPDPGWSDDIERQRLQIAEALAYDGVAVVAKSRAEVTSASTHQFDVGRDGRFPFQVAVTPERVGKNRVELDIRILRNRNPASALASASIQGEIGKTFIVAQNTPGNPVLVAVTPKRSPSPADVGEIKTIGGAVTKPKLVHPVEPRYPDGARKEKATGQVVVQIVIEKDGTVGRATVVRPVRPDLDAAAVEAVRQWRYEPAKQDGRAVAVYMTITVDFRLD